ncbi:hypothetical protein [Burkholderia cepacia]|uniref:hypothetical protein n=1 Tax=Burkholderia cepacia TaxID=292 RepID=UPI000A6938A2|nr:hypothetical protein [Burkholderia cepacia]UIY55731.1 hypothetical protein LZ568_12925 [Burkholderia cepacia]
MTEKLDSVARYGMALEIAILPRTILVEGTTDVKLFQLAAAKELEKTGFNLLGEELAIVAAGDGDRGGTRGVIRELIGLRGMARTCLLQNGTPRYRFVGLFDNDHAGRLAIKLSRDIDTSILEYKDIFRLHPAMPLPGNLDPGSMQRAFEKENAAYKGLDWELEDLMPSAFMEVFFGEYPTALIRTCTAGGKLHRELTRDGKAQLHRFISLYATRDDLTEVIDVLKTFRTYLGLRVFV